MNDSLTSEIDGGKHLVKVVFTKQDLSTVAYTAMDMRLRGGGMKTVYVLT